MEKVKFLFIFLLFAIILFPTSSMAESFDISIQNNEQVTDSPSDSVDNIETDVDTIDGVDGYLNTSLEVEEIDKVEEIDGKIYHSYYYDLSTDHYAYDAIDRLYNIGATNHRNEHKFQPDDLVSRGEFIHMLITAMELPILPDPYLEAGLIGFDDVSAEYPFYQEINIAYRLAIIDGISDELFAPGNPLHRDALLKTIIRAAGILRVEWTMPWAELQATLSPYSDFSSYKNYNDWAPHYLAFAVKNKLVKGYPDNSLQPKKSTTRAEAAVIIDRFLQNKNLNTDNYQIANIVCYDDITIDPNDTELRELDVIEGNNPIENSENDDNRICLSLSHLDKTTMTATMYNSLEAGLSFYTATGIRTRVGVVATDIKFIPHGTHLYIENYGYAVAADTGGAIKGNKIDLYSVTVQEAKIFGRQNITVYILPHKINFIK